MPRLFSFFFFFPGLKQAPSSLVTQCPKMHQRILLPLEFSVAAVRSPALFVLKAFLQARIWSLIQMPRM